MENNNIIQLQNVTKLYGDKKAVNNISLNIRKGEFVTLLGPSGCGKTTTLRMIAGFETPTEGRILFNGEDITSLPPHKRTVNTFFRNTRCSPTSTFSTISLSDSSSNTCPTAHTWTKRAWNTKSNASSQSAK